MICSDKSIAATIYSMYPVVYWAWDEDEIDVSSLLGEEVHIIIGICLCKDFQC